MLNELYLFNINSSTFLFDYLSIILFLVLSFIMVVGLLATSYIITPQIEYPNKSAPYECGFESIYDARKLFSVRFYLVAILFVIFDVEVAFIFPWALVVSNVSLTGFWSAVVFLFILILGFMYELKKGVLEWY